MKIPGEKIPTDVLTVAKRLRNGGFQAWVVGGSVRDLLIGRPVTDYDVATDARPEQVTWIFRKTVPTGVKHGTVTVLARSMNVEVTTFRMDGKYSDARRPDEVTFALTVEEDLSRRDFTINGIAYDPLTDRTVDPFGGREDIARKTIRTIGDPRDRFHEDGLRPFRACRLASQLGFVIEAATFRAISECLDRAAEVSAERVRDELIKIIQSEKPSVGIELLRECGLLELSIPELLTGFDVRQNKYHKYDIYYHNIFSCDAAAPADYRIRLAALFHDIGKSYARKEVGEEKDRRKSVFYNHEIIGAAVTRKILQRLRFSNADVKAITHLIRNHMFHYTSQWTDGAVRRFMRKVGLENIDSLFELRRADRIGNGLKRGESGSVGNLRNRINKVIEAENAITVKDLAVDGYDIMSEFGLEPGPVVGRILRELLERILDDPSKNTRETLLAIAREVHEAKKNKTAPV
jgi:poly(A) polymerase/tRNA nucleotidyltransferase (CCA-adding enzyme)